MERSAHDGRHSMDDLEPDMTDEEARIEWHAALDEAAVMHQMAVLLQADTLALDIDANDPPY